MMKKFLESQFKLEIVGTAILVLGLIASQVIDLSVEDEISTGPITKSDIEKYKAQNPAQFQKFQVNKSKEQAKQLIANKTEVKNTAVK